MAIDLGAGTYISRTRNGLLHMEGRVHLYSSAGLEDCT